jgi:outer membrane lipoprotein carrier protein
MNIRLIALAGLTVCFLFGILRSEAADPTGELITRLQALDHLQGRFEQRQYDDTGQLVQVSGGRFRLLRPDYFAWEIESPDSQLVIAGPRFIWHHDRDLETVTRRPVSGNVDATPLQVLGGDESVLREQFSVSATSKEQYRLEERTGDGSFRELTLRFAGTTIAGMEIVNKLNQRVVITFTEVDAEAALGPADFAFEPPAGADLFYYDE